MTTETQVREAATPQAALVAIAQALDRLLAEPAREPDPWATWAEATSPEARVAEIRQVDEDSAEVTIPPPSPEKLEARRDFERKHLHLYEYLGDDSDTDWTEAYAKGGPMWLYLGNRELANSYPVQIKQAFVRDVLEDSPQDAHEMGRDLLKQPGETGPGGTGMFMADGNVG